MDLVGDGASEFSASSVSAVTAEAGALAGAVADSEGSEEGVGAWLALHPVIKMATRDKVMKLRMRKSSS
ncbi:MULTISPECIES: hypothetical protein [Micrococcaceae]|uniref:hypothetical protein n=1 Tax=Micrococcaceae TaxID=1268 RepID=UPI0013EF7D21|nr:MULTISPECIES: hypothetical protein [Micrococcaceae]UXN32092.1 hypothetical protein N6V40_00830 [Glutamicibacter sp. M10]